MNTNKIVPPTCPIVETILYDLRREIIRELRERYEFESEGLDDWLLEQFESAFQEIQNQTNIPMRSAWEDTADLLDRTQEELQDSWSSHQYELDAKEEIITDLRAQIAALKLELQPMLPLRLTV